MIAATTRRVHEHTPEELNEEIRERTRKNVACFASGGPRAIEKRLEELDREWDIERVLEANAAAISLGGFFLGATVSRRFYLLPAVVAGFLLQHAIQGWCPPVTFFRRRGFRTASEIDEERYALKALRGDFEGLPKVEGPPNVDVERVLDAVRR
jgi:hypothetical protein